MLNYFIFNGIDSRDYGIWIIQKNAYNTPKRNVNFISVPGRDSDIIIDNGNYENVDISYKVRILASEISKNVNSNMEYALDDIKDFLFPIIGNYYKLEDSYNPDYYRMACFTGGMEFSSISKSAEFIDTEINFNCKPYRYSQEGENTISITGSDAVTITNPELYPALPLIQINKGSSDDARVVINGSAYDFDFSNTSIAYIKIDSDTKLVYNLSNNYYGKYSPPSDPQKMFPELKAGNNTIQKTSGTGTVLITPNWRRI